MGLLSDSRLNGGGGVQNPDEVVSTEQTQYTSEHVAEGEVCSVENSCKIDRFFERRNAVEVFGLNCDTVSDFVGSSSIYEKERERERERERSTCVSESGKERGREGERKWESE